MRHAFKRGLPTTLLPNSWASKLLSAPRMRQLQKAFYNVKITLLCGFVTILVLRGTIGTSIFGGSSQDQSESVDFSYDRRKEPSRVLSEATYLNKEEKESNEQELLSSRSHGMAYSLGPKISDWDQQREEWFRKNPQISSYVEPGKPRILLVTGSQPKACENPVGDHYLLKAIKNKIDYCRLHNMEIFYNMAHLDQEMAGFWAKLPLIRTLLLAHPEVEWIWWMDSDALFTDMTFELPIDKYKDNNLVLHGWDELVYEKKNWIGLNTGSFLIRNCQWTLDLLDAWAPMGPKGATRTKAGKILTKYLAERPDFEADDQSALIYLLATQRATWGEKVYLESSFYLHGYWDILVDRYEEMIEKYHPGLGDDRWPFVTHFVGCKPCGIKNDYSAERCLKQMERAFNFADNQILQKYGFLHQDLSSFKAKRIHTDSTIRLQHNSTQT